MGPAEPPTGKSRPTAGLKALKSLKGKPPSRSMQQMMAEMEEEEDMMRLPIAVAVEEEKAACVIQVALQKKKAKKDRHQLMKERMTKEDSADARDVQLMMDEDDLQGEIEIAPAQKKKPKLKLTVARKAKLLAKADLICPKCDNKFHDDETFCRKCGIKRLGMEAYFEDDEVRKIVEQEQKERREEERRDKQEEKKDTGHGKKKASKDAHGKELTRKKDKDVAASKIQGVLDKRDQKKAEDADGKKNKEKKEKDKDGDNKRVNGDDKKKDTKKVKGAAQTILDDGNSQ